MSKMQSGPFGLRAPQSIMDWIRKKAEQERRSMNFVLCEILERAKATDEAKGDAA